MVVGGSEGGEEDAKKDNALCEISKLNLADQADHREGEVRDDIPEVRNPEQGTPVGKRVVTLVLRKGRHQNQEDQDGQDGQQNREFCALRNVSRHEPLPSPNESTRQCHASATWQSTSQACARH